MAWKNERDAMTPAPGIDAGVDSPALRVYEKDITSETRYETLPYACVGNVVGIIDGSIQQGVTIDSTGLIVDFGAGNLTGKSHVIIIYMA